MNEAGKRILQPEDRAALETFLLPRVESSMFLIGNMRHAGLVDSGRPYAGTYAAAFAGGQIHAVVAHYWNGNLVLQAPVHAAALCRLAVQASQRPVSGLVGPADQVAAARRGLELDAAQVQLDETQSLYSLAQG